MEEIKDKSNILELHYYTGNHEILLSTLNECSNSINNIIKELCKIKDNHTASSWVF